MREKDRDLRRRRQRRLERLRQRNQEEVAKRKTARTEGSKRTLKATDKEADATAAAAGRRSPRRSPRRRRPPRTPALLAGRRWLRHSPRRRPARLRPRSPPPRRPRSPPRRPSCRSRKTAEPGTSMRIAIGADHAGFILKDHLRARLADAGHELLDFGTHAADSVDYPDYAGLVARAVADGEAERGILVCGSGIGMAIAANRFRGVRAAACVDLYSARLSRASTTTPTSSRWEAASSLRRLRRRSSTSFSPPLSKAAATRAASPSWTETVDDRSPPRRG